MAFDIQEALRSARDYWTPERIAASVPLDTLFTVYGDTSGLVESCPTRGIGEHAAKSGDGNAPTSDHVSREDNPAAITPEAITPALLHGSQSQRPATRSQRREVKDEELKLTPYQSIGKVYARKKGCKDPNFNVHVTAFYIGQPTEVNGEEYHQILTVAHAFDHPVFQEADEFIFVPSIYAKTNGCAHERGHAGGCEKR